MRLAQKLTGWTLEVKSEGQKQVENKAAGDAAATTVSKLEGVGPKTLDILINGGITEIARLAAATVEELTALDGIGEKTAAKIIASAKAVATETGAPAEGSPQS